MKLKLPLALHAMLLASMVSGISYATSALPAGTVVQGPAAPGQGTVMWKPAPRDAQDEEDAARTKGKKAGVQLDELESESLASQKDPSFHPDREVIDGGKGQTLEEAWEEAQRKMRGANGTVTSYVDARGDLRLTFSVGKGEELTINLDRNYPRAYWNLPCGYADPLIPFHRINDGYQAVYILSTQRIFVPKDEDEKKKDDKDPQSNGTGTGTGTGSGTGAGTQTTYYTPAPSFGGFGLSSMGPVAVSAAKPTKAQSPTPAPSGSDGYIPPVQASYTVDTDTAWLHDSNIATTKPVTVTDGVTLAITKGSGDVVKGTVINMGKITLDAGTTLYLDADNNQKSLTTSTTDKVTFASPITMGQDTVLETKDGSWYFKNGLTVEGDATVVHNWGKGIVYGAINGSDSNATLSFKPVNDDPDSADYVQVVSFSKQGNFAGTVELGRATGKYGAGNRYVVSSRNAFQYADVELPGSSLDFTVTSATFRKLGGDGTLTGASTAPPSR